MRRIANHIRHNVKNVRPSNTNPTTQGAVMDLRQIGDLYKTGTPLSMSNLPTSQLPADMMDFGCENPVVDFTERRGVDINECWEAQLNARERLGNFKKHFKTSLQSAPTTEAPATE